MPQRKPAKQDLTPEGEDTAVVLNPTLSFMRTMWQLNHALELASRFMERTIGVTAQQRMVIRCIGEAPGISPSQLARLLHLDRSSISSVLHRLDAAKLIIRRKAQDDGRAVTLWLSAKGKRVNQPSQHTVEGAVARTLEASSTKEQRVTIQVMRQLADELLDFIAPSANP